MVVAYDIRSPKRARAVRRHLDTVNHAKQYSVYETRLGPGELRRLLNDVQACCDPSADQLAAWWPVDSMRLIWNHNGLQTDIHTGPTPNQTPPTRHTNIGNFIAKAVTHRLRDEPVGTTQRMGFGRVSLRDTLKTVISTAAGIQRRHSTSVRCRERPDLLWMTACADMTRLENWREKTDFPASRLPP